MGGQLFSTSSYICFFYLLYHNIAGPVEVVLLLWFRLDQFFFKVKQIPFLQQVDNKQKC